MKDPLIFVVVMVLCCTGITVQLPLILSSSNSESMFSNPQQLQKWGYNCQILDDSIDLGVQWEAVSPSIFPKDSSAWVWLQKFQSDQTKAIAAVKAAGLTVISTNDLVIWPLTLIQMFKSEITDPVTGKISIDKPKTLELLGDMFDELVTRFPGVDGYMIRVGETYLPSEPFFGGNGLIDFTLPSASIQDQYVKLISFLRQKVCVQHNKLIIFRTWDTAGGSPDSPGRFHSNLTFYLNVTNQIPPHENLIFSVKHTALDFWRFVKWNPCLTQGKHQQVIEVECQREYEGKGSFPNYIGDGVINGFSELLIPVGLRNISSHPLIVGLWTWGRGGGWNGPYIGKLEIWPKLNARVVSRWFIEAYKSAQIPSEEQVFVTVCSEDFGIPLSSCSDFHKIALISQDAVLHMRYCTPYDQSLKNEYYPTANWLRDDRLGGLHQLNGGDGKKWNDVFSYLYQHNIFSDAISEKQQSVSQFDQIVTLTSSLQVDHNVWYDQILTQSIYGSFLSQIILYGWEVLSIGFVGDQTGKYDIPALKTAILNYDVTWVYYNSFTSSNYSATPFCGCYESFSSNNGTQPVNSPGLDDSVNKYRKIIQSVNKDVK